MFKLTKFLIALIICMVKVNYSIRDDFGNDIISNNKQLTTLTKLLIMNSIIIFEIIIT